MKKRLVKLDNGNKRFLTEASIAHYAGMAEIFKGGTVHSGFYYLMKACSARAVELGIEPDKTPIHYITFGSQK